MRDLLDRALGAYLGLAIGDALGATVEFMRPREIQLQYGVHRDIVGGGWLKLARGQVTDDTGVGDPAWDLARPAAFWAAGLLPDEPWTILLNAYRAAGGPAVPPAGDPWTDLDPPARAATLIAAARSLRSGESPATTRALLQACRRMQDS